MVGRKALKIEKIIFYLNFRGVPCLYVYSELIWSFRISLDLENIYERMENLVDIQGKFCVFSICNFAKYSLLKMKLLSSNIHLQSNLFRNYLIKNRRVSILMVNINFQVQNLKSCFKNFKDYITESVFNVT